MKFLPPIIAALVVTAWLTSRHHSIKSMEREVATLEQRIRAAGTTPAGPPGDHSLASRVREERDALLQPGQPIDWQRIANRFAASPHNRLEMADFAALQQRVMEMPPDELVAALDEIEALGLPAVVNSQLEGMLLGQLARKDPQQALEKYGDKIGSKDGQYSWRLTEAIGTWAKDDPAAAAEWFDRKIAEGLFDSTSLSGHNQNRIRFEAAMISALLSDNFDLAAKRLAGVPEGQRASVLQQHWSFKLVPSRQQAFADLTRKTLPPNQQLSILGNVAYSLAGGSDAYQKVSEFIQNTEPTPQERQTIATEVARRRVSKALQTDIIDRQSVERLQQWLTIEAPDDAGTITGAAFGNHSKNRQQAVEIITELHTETGDEDLLITYLDRTAKVGGPDISLTLPLLEKISDPQRREELRTQLTATEETGPQ